MKKQCPAAGLVHCDLDNPEWLAEQVENLLEYAIHAAASGGTPKKAVAQAVRHNHSALSSEGRKRLREVVYQEWEEIEKEKNRPNWMSGDTFDEVRRKHKKTRERNKRSARKGAKKQTGAKKKEIGKRSAKQDKYEPLAVQVEGPWGSLRMAILQDGQGLVRIKGSLDDAVARTLMQWLLNNAEDARLTTNRAER